MNHFKSNLINCVFFPIGDLMLGTEVVSQLKINRKYTDLSQSELFEIQYKKLNKILIHAISTCEYYKGYYRNIETIEWLKKFPVITKRLVLNKCKDFLSSEYQLKDLIKYESSGSSGIRSQIYMDREEQSICRAILINWWEWNGYYLGKPLLQTGMTPDRGVIKGIKDFMLSTIYVDAYGSDENYLVEKLRKVEYKKGFHLFGYAASLYILAQVAEKHGLNIRFDMAMSQGDKLFDHYKKKIEEVFNCPVVEDYGLNEGIMIGQKKDLPYFYIYTPSVYIEILDENNLPVPDGTMGRIIATKLDGYAMPLIRYDTGDLGIMLPREKYPEKRDLAFPLLKTVIGRNTDIIKTSDGKSLIVHSFTGVFEFFPEIIQFQVIQDATENITIKYIPSPTFKVSALSRIDKMFRERTGTDIIIRWEEVERIPPSKSGKPQIIINNLNKKSLADEIN